MDEPSGSGLRDTVEGALENPPFPGPSSVTAGLAIFNGKAKEILLIAGMLFDAEIS